MNVLTKPPSVITRRKEIFEEVMKSWDFRRVSIFCKRPKRLASWEKTMLSLRWSLNLGLDWEVVYMLRLLAATNDWQILLRVRYFQCSLIFLSVKSLQSLKNHGFCTFAETMYHVLFRIEFGMNVSTPTWRTSVNSSKPTQWFVHYVLQRKGETNVQHTRILSHLFRHFFYGLNNGYLKFLYRNMNSTINLNFMICWISQFRILYHLVVLHITGTTCALFCRHFSMNQW